MAQSPNNNADGRLLESPQTAKYMDHEKEWNNTLKKRLENGFELKNDTCNTQKQMINRVESEQKIVTSWHSQLYGYSCLISNSVYPVVNEMLKQVLLQLSRRIVKWGRNW